MDEQTFSLRARDGAHLVFARWGEPTSGRRVALIHSLAMDHRFWAPVATLLSARGVCVVALDCRGHGASDKSPGPYSVELFANDVADLFDHVGWLSAVVAGSSMGGSVALAFALNHPQKTSGLALIDTTSWYGAEAPKAWAQRADAALEKGLSSLIDFQLGRWFSDEFRAENPQVAQTCLNTFVANDLPSYAATCRMLGAFDLRPRLGEIRAPTRILVGEEDYATPIAMAQTLHAGIAGSSLQVLAKARHLTPLEAPDEIASEIETLLAAAGRGSRSVVGSGGQNA